MNWNKMTLGEIYDEEGGAVQTGPFGSQLHESDYKDEGIPVIMPKDIIDDKISESNIARINESDAKRLKKYRIELNDIVFPRRGDIGKRALVTADQVGWLCGTGCIRLRGTEKLLDPHFLFYFLKQNSIVTWIENQAVGATMMNLNTSILRSIPLELPPLPIQKKVASILSAYDELIENNNQRIALLEQMAEEIYKEWFVRLRFPGYENTPIVDGVSEGWDKVKLRDCIQHYIGGGWGDEEPNGKNELPAYVIRGTDIPDFRIGKLNFDVLRYHSASNLSSRRLEENDIVFEVSGGTETQSLGRTAFIQKEALERFGQDVICASFCKLIRVKKDFISPYYINSVLNRLYSTGELMVFQVQSTGICNYQFEDFLNAQTILKPSQEIQQTFEDAIRPMLKEIQVLGAKNENLRKVRDLLLPRLISGKLSIGYLLEKSQMQFAN